MSRRPYVHLAGDLSGWPKGFAPTPAILRKLDQFSSELVNGEEGGSWSPRAPIVIGPSGSPTITLNGATNLLSGDVETVKGNRLDTSLDATPGLVLTGGAVPTLASPLTRSVAVPFTGWRESYVVAGFVLGNLASGLAGYELDPIALCPTALSTIDLYVYGNKIIVSVPLPFRAMHRNATITSVAVRVRIAGQLRSLPTLMPSIRVVRVRGNTQVALHSNGGGYDADGWLVDTSATVSAYTNSGEAKTYTYTPNQNNTAIDPSQDYFMIQMRGGQTTGGASVNHWVGSQWISGSVVLSNIVDLRQE